MQAERDAPAGNKKVTNSESMVSAAAQMKIVNSIKDEKMKGIFTFLNGAYLISIENCSKQAGLAASETKAMNYRATSANSERAT